MLVPKKVSKKKSTENERLIYTGKLYIVDFFYSGYNFLCLN